MWPYEKLGQIWQPEKNLYLQKMQSQSGHKRISQTDSLELCGWYLESENLE